MAQITGPDPRGVEWTPEFVTNLDQAKCRLWPRCCKVCPRNVLDLVERGSEDDDDSDDDNMMVMSIANGADCIGCGSCGRVCPEGLLHLRAGERVMAGAEPVAAVAPQPDAATGAAVCAAPRRRWSARPVHRQRAGLVAALPSRRRPTLRGR